MKNTILKEKYILLGFICCLTFSCSAQITPLRDFNDYNGDRDGRYFKDLQNDLDPFVGTWKYTAQDTIITMELSVYKDYDYGDILKI